MKKMIFLAIYSLLVLTCSAQSKSECFRYLRKYDVPNGYLEIVKGDNVGFWTKRKDYDKRLHKIMNSLTNYDSKSALKAKETIFWKNIEAGKILKGMNTMNDVYKDKLDSLQNVFQLWKIDLNLKFYVVPSNVFNAGACPNGAIIINKGLIDNVSFNELVAVIAHEINHFVNKHSQQELYAVAKKAQSNKFWAGIGSAMTGVAAGVNAYYGGMAGQSQETLNQSSQNFAKLINDIYDTSEKATINFKFRYSREEEIESDIAAYRFLQAIGKDPQIMIDVIDIISKIEGVGVTSDKHDDHPTAVVRRNILQSIKEFDNTNKADDMSLKKISVKNNPHKKINTIDDMYMY